MNAEICGSKNTIGQMASVLKKLQKATFTFYLYIIYILHYILAFSTQQGCLTWKKKNPNKQTNCKLHSTADKLC